MPRRSQSVVRTATPGDEGAAGPLEPGIYKARTKIQLRTAPDAESEPTGQAVFPGEAFRVVEVAGPRTSEGVAYLRVCSGPFDDLTGWLLERGLGGLWKGRSVVERVTGPDEELFSEVLTDPDAFEEYMAFVGKRWEADDDLEEEDDEEEAEAEADPRGRGPSAAELREAARHHTPGLAGFTPEEEARWKDFVKTPEAKKAEAAALPTEAIDAGAAETVVDDVIKRALRNPKLEEEWKRVKEGLTPKRRLGPVQEEAMKVLNQMRAAVKEEGALNPQKEAILDFLETELRVNGVPSARVIPRWRLLAGKKGPSRTSAGRAEDRAFSGPEEGLRCLPSASGRRMGMRVPRVCSPL